jgi:hypothetical protein
MMTIWTIKYIMDELVSALREAKLLRQIVLVSNNANVVINSVANAGEHTSLHDTPGYTGSGPVYAHLRGLKPPTHC